MNIKDILDIEKENKDKIYLFKEGYFYRAYEMSAKMFIDNIRKIKAIRKYYKHIDKDLVYCGISKNLADKLARECNEKGFSVKITPNNIQISSFNMEYDDFLSWKNSLDIKSEKQHIPKEITFIFNKIMRYPVESKTPLEAMQFIHELKQSIDLLDIQNGEIFTS